jgi:cytochrome c oxidase subunit 2
MSFRLPFTPVQASDFAAQVDLLYLYLLAISTFFSVLIFVLVFYFAIKYRSVDKKFIPKPIHGNLFLEITWTIIPFLIAMSVFVWGAVLFYQSFSIPKNADEIFVVGKQWMWKIQHPEGKREINQLHVPVNRPIKLTITSEDVIHDFYIPAFRIKMDAVPGRYTQTWFKATKEGTYHLFCAEYCGTEHAKMIGKVTVMSEAAYEGWLANESSGQQKISAVGSELFESLKCNTCHRADNDALGPNLDNLFGEEVLLSNGRKVTADETYIRESILQPAKKVKAGYSPMMPSYQGQVSEEEIIQIIQYLKEKKATNQEMALQESGGDNV